MCDSQECGSQCEEHENTSENEINEEVRYVEKVVNAFFFYKKYGRDRTLFTLSQLRKIPQHHQKLVIESHSGHMKEVLRRHSEDCVLLKRMVTYGAGAFGCADKVLKITQLRQPDADYISKVNSTIRQIVREWSVEGKADRDKSFQPIMEELRKRYPNVEQRASVSILVPGCGLGRLPWDLVTEGFSVIGNEFSVFMLIISSFILNSCQEPNSCTLHPYLFDKSNSWSYEDQLRPIHFPDVSPRGNNSERKNVFGMCAGDFLDISKEDIDRWDVVVTAWFIDTANNIMEYIERIHKILKVGGVWINVGPLTYHYEDTSDELSIELPYSEIKRIIVAMGFEMKEEKRIESKYTWNQRSMLHSQYECAFFVATKKEPVEKEI